MRSGSGYYFFEYGKVSRIFTIFDSDIVFHCGVGQFCLGVLFTVCVYDFFLNAVSGNFAVSAKSSANTSTIPTTSNPLMIFDRHPDMGSKFDRHFWARGYYAVCGKLSENHAARNAAIETIWRQSFMTSTLSGFCLVQQRQTTSPELNQVRIAIILTAVRT